MARWLMVAGVVALCGGSVMAQRGGGAGGGFGGGMGGFGGPVNLRTGLFSNKALQEELKITEDQATKLKEFTTKQTEAMKEFQPPAPAAGAGGRPGQPGAGGGRPGQPGGGGRPGAGGAGGGFGGFGGGMGGFGAPAVQRDEEEQLKMLKVQVKLLEERIALVKATLTADQQKRLAQLETQQLGTAAFTNAKVVKALGMSEEQTKKVKDLSDEMAKEMQTMSRDAFQGGFDQEKMAELQKKQKNLREETAEKIEKTLTDEQRKKWKDMTGEAFDFAKLTPRPMRNDQ